MCNTHGKAGGLTKISRNPFPSQPINWAGHCIASNGSDRPSDIGPKDPTLGRLFKMSTEIVLLLTTIYGTSRLLAIKKFCWYLQTNVFGFRLKRGFDSSFGFPWPSAGKSGNRTVVGFRKNVLGAFVRKKKDKFIHQLDSLGHLLVGVVIKRFCWFPSRAKLATSPPLATGLRWGKKEICFTMFFSSDF